MAPTIDATYRHIFAVKTNGELWAVNVYLEEDFGDPDGLPVKVLDNCVSVSTGAGGTFAVKSHAGEFQQLSYDAITAHTAIVFLRYSMLAVEKRRQEDDRSVGDLFYLNIDLSRAHTVFQ
jgi:hypothetical protein